MLDQRLDPVGAAVEKICLELAEKALELYEAEPEPWRPEQEPPPEIAELLGTWWEEGTPFVFWWEQGRLRARPEESDMPRAVSSSSPTAPTGSASPRGASAASSCASSAPADGSIEKLYWATYPVTRAADGVLLASAGLVEDQPPRRRRRR